MDAVNKLGIGAKAWAVSRRPRRENHGLPDPCCILACAMIPNCAATRHAHFELKGDGPVYQEAPSLEAWPEVTWEPGESVRRVDLDTVTREETLLGSRAILCCSQARCTRVETLHTSA